MCTKGVYSTHITCVYSTPILHVYILHLYYMCIFYTYITCVYSTPILHVYTYRCNTCVVDACVIQCYTHIIHLKHQACITGVAQLAMYLEYHQLSVTTVINYFMGSD